MSDAAESCVACALVAGRIRPTGGMILEERGLHLHGVAAATPVAGWVVLTTTRHVRCLADLTDDEATHLARLAVRVQRAQRDVLGAEIAYAVSLGESVPHFHLHLIPRYAATPERLRGARIATQGLHRDLIGAGGAPETEVDAAGIERLQRAELLGDHQR